ncbi:MAG: hypothetical protein B6D41_02170, partial [Chloroflexi bacterium UTCFX4]
ACGGAASTPISPTAALTAAPTVAPPTVAPPTVAPPTVAPTSAPPTLAPIVASSQAAASALDALKKFADAENFRLKADVSASPEIFQMPYEPGPNDDPNLVRIVTLDGASHAADLQYTFGGFLGSFLGTLVGFAPTNPTLELIVVEDQVFMRGIWDGETAAKWYLLPGSQSQATDFKPQDIVKTVTEVDFAQATFTKSGAVTIGAQTCDVYTGDRAAFDAVLPHLTQEAGLNSAEIDTTKLTETDFQVTVCPDGNVYHIVYAFQVPVKSKPTVTGKFNYEAHLSDFAETIVIQAPTGAVPMPGAANVLPTEEPSVEATETRAAAGVFTLLEGEWEGTSSSDSPIQFTVQDGKISYVNLNYAIFSGGCSASGAYGTAPDNGALQDDKFTVILTNSDQVEFIFTGSFESKNHARGSLNITGKTFCGDVAEEFTWTAEHITAPDSGGAETPTMEATPARTVEPEATPTSESSAPSVDGVTIAQNTFMALNQGDVNTALAAFSDDVVFNLGGMSGVGKDQLQSYLQTATAAGAKYTASNIQDLGGIITFAVTISGPISGTYPNSSIIIEDGKITVLAVQ